MLCKSATRGTQAPNLSHFTRGFLSPRFSPWARDHPKSFLSQPPALHWALVSWSLGKFRPCSTENYLSATLEASHAQDKSTKFHKSSHIHGPWLFFVGKLEFSKKQLQSSEFHRDICLPDQGLKVHHRVLDPHGTPRRWVLFGCHHHPWSKASKSPISISMCIYHIHIIYMYRIIVIANMKANMSGEHAGWWSQLSVVLPCWNPTGAAVADGVAGPAEPNDTCGGRVEIPGIPTKNLGNLGGVPPKWGYPQSSSMFIGWSNLNHPAIGVPPWPWKPPFDPFHITNHPLERPATRLHLTRCRCKVALRQQPTYRPGSPKKERALDWRIFQFKPRMSSVYTYKSRGDFVVSLQNWNLLVHTSCYLGLSGNTRRSSNDDPHWKCHKHVFSSMFGQPQKSSCWLWLPLFPKVDSHWTPLNHHEIASAAGVEGTGATLPASTRLYQAAGDHNFRIKNLWPSLFLRRVFGSSTWIEWEVHRSWEAHPRPGCTWKSNSVQCWGHLAVESSLSFRSNGSCLHSSVAATLVINHINHSQVDIGHPCSNSELFHWMYHLRLTTTTRLVRNKKNWAHLRHHWGSQGLKDKGKNSTKSMGCLMGI